MEAESDLPGHCHKSDLIARSRFGVIAQVQFARDG